MLCFQKLWAVCDLATSLLYSKTTNFELKEFPAHITLRALYFKPHPEGENFVNGAIYIPQDMVWQPSKKGGVSLFVARKTTKTTKVVTGLMLSDSNDQFFFVGGHNQRGESQGSIRGRARNGRLSQRRGRAFTSW